MSTYNKALKYLGSFTNYELLGMDGVKDTFDLKKIRDVLDSMGKPDSSYRSIHVAGTKGKGSTAAFISAILKEHGFKVGLFTSPHLTDMRERIAVNGEIISKEDLAECAEAIEKVVTPEAGFTYFEALTVMAVIFFKKEGVDFAVFETGLGGRLDATNVLAPEASVITPISYDHMNVLGDTLEEIAREKAAIIKKGSFCVSSPQKEQVADIIKKRCLWEKVPLYVSGEDMQVEDALYDTEGSSLSIKGIDKTYEDCRINMAGEFQAVNAMTATGVCEKLLRDDLDEEALKRGLEDAFIPGRLEILASSPRIVVDGAQNAESAARLKDSIEAIFKYDRLILLLGMSKDKDVEGFCRALSPAADKVILTKVDMDRAADPVVMRGYFSGKDVKVTRDVKEALGLAFFEAGDNDLILITGSFFLIGEVRRAII